MAAASTQTLDAADSQPSPPGAAYPPPPPPPPGYGYPPPPPPGYGYAGYPTPPAREPAGQAPPAIWIVAVGLVIMAILAVYPVAGDTPDVIKEAVTGNSLNRAFASFVLEILVIVWASAFALVSLAVGLVKGSRVAQLIACLLAGIFVVAEFIEIAHPSAYDDSSKGIAAGIIACAVAVVVLVLAPNSSREFFARDTRPPGISAAATANVYLGAVLMLDGAIICLAGIAGVKYVIIGVVLALVAAALVATSRGLRVGSSAALAFTLVIYAVLAAAIVWFGVSVDQLLTFATLLPLGIVVGGAAGLLGPASSKALFSGPPLPRPPLGAAAIVATVIALVLVAAAAGVGIYSANKGFEYSDYEGSSEPSVPSYDPSTSSTVSGIDESDARLASTDFLNGLEGSASAPMCDGADTPDLSISDYSVDDITPDTSGSFDVSATVTLDDGTSTHVTYEVRDDGSGSGCVEADSVTTDQGSSGSTQTTTAPTEPDDVPTVASAADPVPTDAALPATPSDSAVPYTDSSTVPTTEDEIVEYQPDGLDTDQADAVRSVIAFMTHVNQQDFQSAWDDTTEQLIKADYDSSFSHGYATTHFMQAAFGQPEAVSDNLMIVPGRFVSRQDPSAQGNPSGVTDCTYWPQYMFLLANVDGHWLVDVARKYQDRSAVAPYKRQSESGTQLNPIQQRVTC